MASFSYEALGATSLEDRAFWAGIWHEFCKAEKHDPLDTHFERDEETGTRELRWSAVVRERKNELEERKLAKTAAYYREKEAYYRKLAEDAEAAEWQARFRAREDAAKRKAQADQARRAWNGFKDSTGSWSRTAPPPPPKPPSQEELAAKILGIDPKADETEIKKAYREKVKLHHPDRGGNRLMFEKVQEAYEVLTR